ncbi:DsbA family protein [Brevibacterium samyangense]|uniref:Thioredoxin domain-containing protein n=1 Tax=Brevibacterium samyangense TaxID=366888 RepID=A0ABP5EJ77_9MICO
MAKNNPSGPDRRQNAREQARRLAEAQAKRDKIGKIVLFSGIGVVVVAVAVIVTMLFVNAAKPAASPSTYVAGGVTLAKSADGAEHMAIAPPKPGDAEVPAELPTAADSGLKESAAHVQVFLDFQCPACKSFEEANGQNLATLLDEGTISLEYNPVAILDSQSGGNEYSTRSANAFAAVADSGQAAVLFDVVSTLFENQPAEGASGMDDEQLCSLLEQAGVDLEAPTKNAVDGDGNPLTVREAITEVSFEKTVSRETQSALSDRGVEGTPTVKINGETTDWSDPQAFATEVLRAAGEIG